MKHYSVSKSFLVLVCFFVSLFFFVQLGIAADSDNQCIKYDVPSCAEISKVSYFMDSYEGEQRLHMEIGVKNTSDELKRFRVHISLDQGVTGGGLYPRKGEGVEPGEVHTRNFPMYYDELPVGFEIKIQELNK